MNSQRSLAVTYFDPESAPVPEPTPEPEEPKPAPKKRGRPKGSRNKPRKKKLPWFTMWRSSFWFAVGIMFVASTYQGVQGLLGQSAAYLALAVSTLATAFFLDRDWKKTQAKK